jgi:hypothetical protein
MQLICKFIFVGTYVGSIVPAGICELKPLGVKFAGPDSPPGNTLFRKFEPICETMLPNLPKVPELDPVVCVAAGLLGSLLTPGFAVIAPALM